MNDNSIDKIIELFCKYKNPDYFNGLTPIIQKEIENIIKEYNGNLATKSKQYFVNKHKYCFTTLVMRGDNYVAGALVQAYTLKIKYKTKYDVNVMVTKDVSDQAKDDLAILFDKIIPIDYIEIKNKELKRYIGEFHKRKWGKYMSNYDWLDLVLTKFNVMRLVEYEKVCFLDADVIAMLNPDNIFMYKTPAGTTKYNIQGANTGSVLLQDDIYNSLKQYGIRGGLFTISPYKRLLDDFLEFCNNKNLMNYLNRNFNSVNAGPDETLLTLFYNYGNNNNSQWHKLPNNISNQNFGLSSTVFQHFYIEKPWVIKKKYPEFLVFYRDTNELLKNYPSLKLYFNESIF